jgi:hypothetical protein
VGDPAGPQQQHAASTAKRQRLDGPAGAAVDV